MRLDKLTGYGCIKVRSGVGYAVAVFQRDGSLVEEYTAGDSRHDSQVYGTGDLDRSVMLRYARQTAREIMNENGLVGPIGYDPSLVI